MNAMIGIVGGVGPKAGEDLHAKILVNTRASSDADHLRILLYTNPAIPDRTAYLLGEIKQNPAIEIIRSMRLLVASGASVLCVPCNTAHSPPIWDTVAAELGSFAPDVKLLNIIEAATNHISGTLSSVRSVGILATTGTVTAGVYQSALSSYGIEPLIPPDDAQRAVHEAIYHRDWGIKAMSAPVSPAAVEILRTAAADLTGRGAEAVILGCTEIPLALTGSSLEGAPLIDPASLLAREAIVRVAGEDKLSPSTA